MAPIVDYHSHSHTFLLNLVTMLLGLVTGRSSCSKIRVTNEGGIMSQKDFFGAM